MILIDMDSSLRNKTTLVSKINIAVLGFKKATFSNDKL